MVMQNLNLQMESVGAHIQATNGKQTTRQDVQVTSFSSGLEDNQCTQVRVLEKYRGFKRHDINKQVSLACCHTQPQPNNQTSKQTPCSEQTKTQQPPESKDSSSVTKRE